MGKHINNYHFVIFASSTQVVLQFPDDKLVYDYKLDDAGISRVPSKDDDEEEEGPKQTQVYIDPNPSTPLPASPITLLLPMTPPPPHHPIASLSLSLAFSVMVTESTLFQSYIFIHFSI